MVAPTRTWWFGLAVSLVVLGVLAILPPQSPAAVVLVHLVTVAATAVFIVGSLRLPTNIRLVWLWFASALTLNAIGSLLLETQLFGNAPAGWLPYTDVAYLLSYIAMFAGLAVLLNKLLPNQVVETWIDTAIITIAASAVLGTFLLAPLLQETGEMDVQLVVEVLYPLAGLVVLAVFVRILLGLRPANLALALLTLATALFLVSSFWYQWALLRPSGSGTPGLGILWTATVLSYALAVTVPSAGHSEPPRRADTERFDLLTALVLTLCVLSTPVVLIVAAFNQTDWALVWLSFANGFLTTLLLIRGTRLVLEVQAQSRDFASQARRDRLTGIPNRRAWDRELQAAVAYARHSNSALTIALIDVDHFKAFNDTHGHQAGDQLLVAAARAWSQELTDGEVLARYGGEEFALLLPGYDCVSAGERLNQVRASTPPAVTVSIGASELAPAEPPAEALRRADQALYQAKAAGRNQVIVALAGV